MSMASAAPAPAQPVSKAAAPAGPPQQVATVVAIPAPAQQTISSTPTQTPESEILPVSIAKNGFTPSQAAEFLSRFNPQESMRGGDVSLFAFLNFTELFHTATIKRGGPAMELRKAPNTGIGKIRAKTDLGDLSLDEYLANPKSRAQGMVVIHRGRVVFEEYPGMREQDSHVWLSCTKTLSSHVIALLEEDGKIDVQRPIDFYVPQLRETAWAGTKVIDVLDMATGMDVDESNEARTAAPDSVLARMNLAGSGVAYDGKVERVIDVLRSAKRLKQPGEVFEESSANTLLLPVLAEAVQKRRWSDIFQSRIWSKMNVEGDLQIGLAPDGLALSHGMAISRLRDMARYGMLYTPSWNKVAREPLVSQAYLKKIQTGGRTDLYLRGAKGRQLAGSFGGEVPVSNSYQWDAVFSDGDIFKAGFMGQGLYVSPGKDVVIAWFSTAPKTDLTDYVRAIAKTCAGDRS